MFRTGGTQNPPVDKFWLRIKVALGLYDTYASDHHYSSPRLTPALRSFAVHNLRLTFGLSPIIAENKRLRRDIAVSEEQLRSADFNVRRLQGEKASLQRLSRSSNSWA